MKKQTTVTVTVHGIEERIEMDGAHEAKMPREPRELHRSVRGSVWEDPQPVEYDAATYEAIGRHFAQTYRTLVDVHEHSDVLMEKQQDAIREAAERDEERASA